MKRKEWGRIINTSSTLALAGEVGKTASVAAKHGILGLTRTVALEGAELGTTCNAICPGWVYPPLVAAQVEARAAALGLCIEQTAKEHLLNEMPTKRFVGPTEVASAMLLLCSGTARSITRSIALPVDGKCVENCCPGLVAIAGRNPATLGTLMVMETLKAVAHPWFCDAMGHLNVRFYTAFFDDASSFFVGGLGGGADQLGASHLGWADVRHVVEFREEVRSGGLLRVCSRVIKVGRTSLTFQHELTGPSGNLHATMEVVSVMFDLLKRQAVPLPANIRTAAEHLLTQQVE